MLLSHKYRFIFVKTTKTAGTSLEVELSKILGENDIVTPIIPAVEGHAPRNYAPAEASGISKILTKLRLTKSRKFYNHMSANSIRKITGRKVFDTYFKFCVEREPVSKCISHYSMLKNSPIHSKGRESLTWDSYVERGGFPIDTSKYTNVGGALIVDRIIRYESLNEELMEISKRLGFPFDGVKAKAKTGFRVNLDPTVKQKEKIYEAFASSLEHCPYEIP